MTAQNSESNNEKITSVEEKRSDWSFERKKLRKLSIVLIISAVVLIIISGSMVAILGLGLTSTETGRSLTEDQLVTIFNLFVLMFVVEFVILLFGVFSLKAAKNPKKIMPSLFLSCACFVLLLVEIIADLTTTPDIAGAIVSLLLMVFVGYMCYLNWKIRYNREDLGGRPAGNDGAEYPDGFNPKKLGFMRLLMIFLALNIIATVAILTFVSKSQFGIQFDRILDLVNLIFDAILFYLIWKRYAVAKKFAIGMTLFNIIAGTTFNIIAGSFSAYSQLILCTNDLIILFYFLFSRRVDAVLTVRLTDKQGIIRNVEKEETFFKPRTWAFWRSIIVYVCIFSIVGHWMEAGYCTFIKLGWIPGTYDPTSQIWSDWLYPFPVYGIGFAFCAIVFYPIKNWLQKKLPNKWSPLLISYVISALICTGIELILGLTSNQPVDGVYPLWDYSNMFCNFMGQICLQNALAFGFAATIITWIVYPFLEEQRLKLDNNVCNIIFVAVVVFFAILMGLYLVKFPAPGFNISSLA